jgi:hypothetical protein
MTSTTSADRLLKWEVVHDALSIVVPNTQTDTTRPPTTSSSRNRASPIKSPIKKGAAQQQTQRYPAAAGCMQLIHHDGLEAAAQARKPNKKMQLSADAADAVLGSPSAAVQKRIVLHG